MRKMAILVLLLTILSMISNDVLARRGRSGQSQPQSQRSPQHHSKQHRHHHHHHSGHHRHRSTYTSFGFAYGGMSPWYYPWYGSSVVAVPVATEPVNYIQRSENDAPAEHFWFYCTQPQGYYPWVRECQGNWQKVIPFQ